MKKDILKSLCEEEKILFSKVLDKGKLSSRNYEETFTDFMDPYKAEKFSSMVKAMGYLDLNVMCFGGNHSCERVVIGFSKDYMELKEEDFPLVALKISYNGKFSRKLSHREYLGSILSLGINRGKIGDIIALEEGAFVIVKNEISEFLIENLLRVSSTKVTIEKVSFLEIENNIKGGKEENIIVSSLRSDVIISEAFKLSRAKTSTFINNERAFVNFSPLKSTSKSIKEGDLITLRGYGRIKFKEIKGKTKKDRILIVIERFL